MARTEAPLPGSVEQASEVHDTSADAGDAAVIGGGGPVPWDGEKVVPEPSAGTTVVEDLTDAGGPLVIRTSDPELSNPRPPVDPFPTDGTPQIDVPVKK